MQFLRIVLGYALASMAAVVTLLILPAVFLGEPLDPPTSISEFLEATVTFAAFSGIIGAVMLIPSLIFVTVTWEKQGPSLVACLLFGGFGGALSILIILGISGETGNPALLATILLFGFAGILAALVFWFIAVWPRPPALSETPVSLQQSP